MSGAALMDSTKYFGREDQISQILGGTPGAGEFYEVRGIVGAGKSALLKEVGRQAATLGNIVARVSIEDHFSTPELDSSDTGKPRLDAEVKRLGVIYNALVKSIPLGDQVENMRTAFTEAAQRLDHPERTGLVGTGGFLSEGFDAPAALDDPVSYLVQQMRAALNDLVAAQLEQGKRVFLLVDTFELIRRRALGDLLIDVFRGLRQAVVVVARQQPTHDHDVLRGVS